MAVTVLRDPSMLRAAMALGVVHYLLKPFTAATLRQKLEHYRAFRARRLAGAGHPIVQHEVDEVFTALRAIATHILPTGVGHESLHAVSGQLRRSRVMSAAQIAESPDGVPHEARWVALTCPRWGSPPRGRGG
jgi:response regulator of citrate/malate metabolism